MPLDVRTNMKEIGKISNILHSFYSISHFSTLHSLWRRVLVRFFGVLDGIIQ